jgi:transposase
VINHNKIYILVYINREMTKHPNQQFRQLVVRVRNKTFKYPEQKHRKTCWKNYTLSKINDIKSILIFIRKSVDSVFIDENFDKVGRPSVSPKHLVKAILFCEAVGIPERQAQGWLEIIGPFLGIPDKIDDRVIGKAYENPEVIQILKKIFEKTRSSDGILGGDGTGLERSRKENYESTKNKNAGRYMTSIVDSREIVQAFDISGTQECRIMHELVKNIEGKILTLDAGFNDRKLVSEIFRFGIQPFVFPKKSNNINGSIYWKKMYLSFYYDTINWLKIYHQRSHTESFHSSFKRTFGIITKLKFCSKFTQVCARIIIHNFRRINYFEGLK